MALKRAGVRLEDVKLKLQPELMKACGATEFYAYADGASRVLLFVFVYDTAAAAGAQQGSIITFGADNELIHHARAARRQNLLLVAGVEQRDGTPSAEQTAAITRSAAGFASP